MSEKVSYKKVESTESSSKTEKVPLTKFSWGWLPNEKRILIILMILMWGYLFAEYLVMNQKISNKIEGLSEGFFGLKRVILF